MAAAPPIVLPDAPPIDEMLRWCSRCAREVPESSFNRGQWWCRECFGAYYREHADHHRRRANELKRRRVAAARAYVWDVLVRSRCVDCGEVEMCVLDFDHRGAKTGTVMRLARNEVSLARLQAEIALCELRCANCHRRRTAQAAGYFTTRAVPPTGIEPVLAA